MKFTVKAPQQRRLTRDEFGCDKRMQDEDLSNEDIKKLKKLLKRLDDILALLDEDSKDDEDVEVEEKTEVETELDSDTAEGEFVEDDDLETETEETEEKVETFHDSKKSFGAIEKRPIADSANDELDRDAEIAQAWAKRYGGN